MGRFAVALTFACVVAFACVAAAPAARAQLIALPSCSGLVPDLQRSPALVRSGLHILRVDEIVEDVSSSPLARICTGVAHYADESLHLTYTADWRDNNRTDYVVQSHETTAAEEASRALSLRIRTHPADDDGTFSLDDYVPYCGDAEFTKLATAELHLGISARNAFYREPSFRIMSITTNGYGSGVLANCIAEVGNDKEKGAIFLGTDWADRAGRNTRRYQFYILAAGPDGWKLKNRLWELGAE
ncbi:MAG TPA: hypothetical protein VMU87_06055 [Stellaceae bacterium]|nr:hypothetical protein [Stellaceae bacterium]